LFRLVPTKPFKSFQWKCVGSNETSDEKCNAMNSNQDSPQNKPIKGKSALLGKMKLFFQKEKASRAFFSTSIILAILLAGCVNIPNPPDAQLSFKEIQRFQSYEQMLNAIKDSQNRQVNYGFEKSFGMGMPLAQSAVSDSSAPSPAAGAGTDYSTTNIQVEGVDEADIVKSDGKFIYNFSSDNYGSQSELIITDAYPIESSRIVSRTSLNDFYPLEMFILEDRLLVFGNKQGFIGGPVPLEGGSGGSDGAGRTTIAMPDYYPYYYGSGTVSARLYDISDRAFPFLEKEIEFSGNYLTSRLIGSKAYFVVNSYPYVVYPLEKQQDNIIPLMAEDGVVKRIAEPTEIGFLPPTPAESFVTIVSLDLESEETNKETFLGSAQSMFASLDNIYLGSSVWLPPETPIIDDVQRTIFGDNEYTVINKFNLNNGEINFVGEGKVPGHVLNQFSMDEFEGKFRIATTVGQVWNTQSQSQNNLYVLDEQMTRIGALEGLAPGEKIYSARFMGPRAYMVTFKKVDPLFVIDVSNPYFPTVLGKLKIPGYSDYLHPIDSTHIIGVGKDTIDPSGDLLSGRGFDFAWYQGLKMAVFDVSDVSNPIEMHKIVVGDRGTESYALQDHKAFLYDKEKELLVLPIMLAEIPEEEKRPLEENQRSPAYGVPVFQGAFVYRLTLANGFEERGRITHISAEEDLKSGYYYDDRSTVKRALFIDNILYTLSGKMLKANDLDTLQELKEIVFN